jgi:hypothetical protein
MLTLITALMLTQVAAQQQPPKEADPLVCTRARGNHTVGTRLRTKRVCLRKSEWDYVDQNSQRELKQLNDRTLHPAEIKGGR